MKGKNGELLNKVREAEPLFKTEEIHQQVQQTQDAFKTQFEQEMQFQIAQTQETKEAAEEELANSFKTEEAEKIEQDGDDPQEPVPEFVSLNYSGIEYSDDDSAKMEAVKDAIIGYQNAKNSDDFEWIGEKLMEVIKACDKYSFGKFSLFCFGKSKVKLKEVNKVREDAEKAFKDLIKQKKEAKLKEREELVDKLMHEESTFAPDVDVSSNNVPVAEVRDLNKEKLIKDRAKALAKRFKDYSFAGDAELIARKEAEEGRPYTDKELVKQLGTSVDKANFDVEEMVQERLNSMGSVQRFFTNLFGKSSLKAEAMKIKLTELKRNRDLGYF